MCVHEHRCKHILKSCSKILSVSNSVYCAIDRVSCVPSTARSWACLPSPVGSPVNKVLLLPQVSPSDGPSVMLKTVGLRGCLLHYKAAVLSWEQRWPRVPEYYETCLRIRVGLLLDILAHCFPESLLVKPNVRILPSWFTLITVLTGGDRGQRLKYAPFLFFSRSCFFSRFTWPSSVGNVFVS